MENGSNEDRFKRETEQGRGSSTRATIGNRLDCFPVVRWTYFFPSPGWVFKIQSLTGFILVPWCSLSTPGTTWCTGGK